MDVLHVLRKPRTTTVVVHHDLQEIRVLTKVRIVLFSAVERRERVVVPDMPANSLGWGNAVREPIHGAISGLEPVIPQALPSEQLRILEKEAPERDNSAIGRSLATSHSRGPALEREIAFPSALGIDSLFAGRDQTILAKTSDGAAVSSPLLSAERVIEWPLPFTAPHQPVHLVGSQIIFHQAKPEVPSVRVPEACNCSRSSVEIDLDSSIEARHVMPKHVFEPADHPHTTTASSRRHISKKVVLRMVRRLLARDGRIAIVLWMRSGEVSSAEIVIVLLLTVVREWIASRLASTDSASISESGEEERINRGHFLQSVEYLVRAFIDERHRSNLNANHRHLRDRDLSERSFSDEHRRRFQEHPTIHWITPSYYLVTAGESDNR